MPTWNVNLTERYDRFVEEQVKAGRYQNASEVMRAGLQLLEQHIQEHHEKLSHLRSLAAQGFDRLDQGQGIEIDDPRELAKWMADIGRRSAKRVKSRNGGH